MCEHLLNVRLAYWNNNKCLQRKLKVILRSEVLQNLLLAIKVTYLFRNEIHKIRDHNNGKIVG